MALKGVLVQHGPQPQRGPNTGPLGYQVSPGQVLLQAWHDPNLRVITNLSGAIPVPQMDPGWEVIARPRRVGLTEWAGRDPIRLSFGVMFDGLRASGHGGGERVERDCRTLEKLAGHRHGNVPPPKLLLDSAGVIPHDYTHAPHVQWVVEQIEWGDAIRNRTGRRVRQFVDLVLLQVVEDDDLVRLPGIKPRRDYVTAKQGDTLRKIAGRAKTTVAALKKLNPKVRDADKPLKKGTRVRVR